MYNKQFNFDEFMQNAQKQYDYAVTKASEIFSAAKNQAERMQAAMTGYQPKQEAGQQVHSCGQDNQKILSILSEIQASQKSMYEEIEALKTKEKPVKNEKDESTKK